MSLEEHKNKPQFVHNKKSVILVSFELIYDTNFYTLFFCIEFFIANRIYKKNKKKRKIKRYIALSRAI